MKIEKSLMSGSNTLLILKLLSEREMYGYEMIRNWPGEARTHLR